MVDIIPRVYPQSGPLFWRNETSGRLRVAVRVYLDHVCDPGDHPEPTPQQLALLIDYVDYWVHAPCWRSLGGLEALRASIKRVLTVEELRDWLHEALDEGIDPL